jgi:hypothetical protein
MSPLGGDPKRFATGVASVGSRYSTPISTKVTFLTAVNRPLHSKPGETSGARLPESLPTTTTGPADRAKQDYEKN